VKPLTLSTSLASLEALDALASDVLVLSLQAEDRPLRGSAGYCDWRLNGPLSRLVEE